MRTFAMVALTLLVACRGKPEAPVTPKARVHCAPVEQRQWSDVRVLRGTVAAEPDKDAVISPQVAGRLVRVLGREGEAVEKNAIIAEVESLPLHDGLHQAEALLAQANAASEAAGLEATRQEHLFNRGISARQTYEAARAAHGQTDGAVSLAKAQVEIARRNLDRSLVRAPIGGVVVKLLRRTGEVVDGTPGTPVMEIADTASLELSASAQANDLIALVVGQSATATFDALPEKHFSARVRSVSPSVDAATGVGSVRLSLLTDGTQPPLGLLGSAVVTVGSPREALVVPAAAIRNAGGARTEVVECRGAQAHPLLVEVGERKDGAVEIVRGLDGGSRVAIDGLTGLDEGIALEEAQ